MPGQSAIPLFKNIRPTTTILINQQHNSKDIGYSKHHKLPVYRRTNRCDKSLSISIISAIPKWVLKLNSKDPRWQIDSPLSTDKRDIQHQYPSSVELCQ